MLRSRLHRATIITLSVAALLGLMFTPVAAEELGADTGEVVFRVTLTGQVQDEDEFLLVIACEDEWCDDETIGSMPDGKVVISCGPEVADAPTCSATTYEFSVDLQTGPMDYHFFRFRDARGDAEEQLLHTGSWQIHSGRQVISLQYDYPSQSGGGALPDTALPAP